MSNLYKSGFHTLNTQSDTPFVLDVSKRKVWQDRTEQKSKVIRPLEEQQEDIDESQNANHIILDDAMDKAKLVRDDAMMKAAKLIADAEEEAESILEQARQDGFRQGLEEGNMEAMKRADEYLANINQEQEVKLAESRRQMQQEFIQAEKEMVDVTCSLIEKLTGMLVRDYQPVMLHMINNALNAADTSRSFIIRVSEEIYPYIADNQSRIVGAANPGITIEIYGDSKLSRSECLIETDNGIIDLSMDVQVKNLITAIRLMSD